MGKGGEGEGGEREREIERDKERDRPMAHSWLVGGGGGERYVGGARGADRNRKP